MVRGSGRVGMNRFPPPLAGPLVPPFMSRRVPRHPFDIVLCEGAFPRVKPGAHTTEESAFNTVSTDMLWFSGTKIRIVHTKQKHAHQSN